MKNKLEKIFDFLKKNENREYNRILQERYSLATILPYNSIEDKILSLLYDIINTQSQPKIDYVSAFFKKISSNKECLSSFSNFVKEMNGKSDIEINYSSLFIGLKNQEGWGNKTSALFVKNIFHFHNGKYDERLFIWEDTPKTIMDKDIFYLPVDAVIINIFNKLDNSKKWNFTNINKKIEEYYKGTDIEIWDDLWFWGFITQKGTGEDRKFEWNENKYWTLKESSKDKNTIEEIEDKANSFLEFLT